MSTKIYFAGSIRGGRQDVDIYFTIIEQLRGYGQILTEFVGNKEIKASQGTYPGIKDDTQIHDDDVAMLSQCDYVVAEVTQPSLGVGYELGRANAMNKRILCLYRRQEGKLLSAMIKGAENGSNFKVVEYTDVSEVTEILKNYFNSSA